MPHEMWGLGSLTRDQTCALCIKRQSLNHWAASDILNYAIAEEYFNMKKTFLTKLRIKNKVNNQVILNLLHWILQVELSYSDNVLPLS